MDQRIDLKIEYLTIIKDILNQHLPAHAKVWLFGSRVTGKAKKYSDIDLLVDIGLPIPQQTMTALNLAFDESGLPYKVDIADAMSISPGFRENIQSQLVFISQKPKRQASP